ncbi:MAG: ABC transporter ATP-binding protein, partial [Desulfopila sp.]
MRNFGYEEDNTTVPLTDYHLWGRIFTFCKKHWLLLGLAVMLSFVITGATLGLPYLLQHAIDNYITNDELTQGVRFSGLTTVSAFFFALVIIILVATFFQVVTLEWIGQSIMHRIRQDLFAHIITLDPPFFDRTPTGRLVTRLTNDIQNMHEMFTSILVTIFNDLLRIAGILVVLFVYNARLALIMCLFVPLAMIITQFFAQLARTQFRSIRSQLAKMNSFLSEAVSGISTLQIFGRQKESRTMFENLSGEYLRRNLKQIKLFGTFMPLTEFMSSTAIALILWFGGREILRDQLTIGELVAFLSYMRLFFQPLRELAQKYSIVQSAMASAERIFQLFDQKSSLALPQKPVSAKNRTGSMRFADVSFRYDGDTDILKKIDFSVAQGETVALVGTTGSGKTTIVNLLLRFYEPHTGTIQIDGIDIHRFN